MSFVDDNKRIETLTLFVFLTTDRGDPASQDAWLDVPQRNLATEALDQGSRIKDEG